MYDVMNSSSGAAASTSERLHPQQSAASATYGPSRGVRNPSSKHDLPTATGVQGAPEVDKLALRRATIPRQVAGVVVRAKGELWLRYLHERITEIECV